MPQSLDSFDNSDGLGISPPKLGNTPDLRVTNEGQSPKAGAPGADPFGGERFRGSSELPITPEGLMKAHQLGQQLARKGGLDRLLASPLGRTMQTAKIISHYTHAPIVGYPNGLKPWALGGLEGQHVTKDNVDFMNHLITEEPDLKLPGRGPLSTSDGESFNDFKDRTIETLKQAISQSRANPQERTGLVTHYRVRKLLEAWMRNGMPDNGDIDRGEMTLHDSKSSPGSMERLVVDPYAGPQIHSVDLRSPALLGGGIYFIRHEATPWNSKPAGGGQGTS